jgi:hypothetical protein
MQIWVNVETLIVLFPRGLVVEGQVPFQVFVCEGIGIIPNKFAQFLEGHLISVFVHVLYFLSLGPFRSV